MTTTLKRWAWTIAAACVLAAALLVMTEIDSLLLTIQDSAGRGLTLATVEGPSFAGNGGVGAALDLWFSTFVGVNVGALVVTYALLDCVVAAAYGAALFLALRSLYPRRPQLAWIGVAAAGADLVENLIIAAATAHHGWAGAVTPFTAIKLLLIVVAVVLVVWTVVQRLLLDEVQRAIGAWVRVAWHFRVQVIIVGLLAALIAVPSKNRLSFLEQLPDLLRSRADLGPGWVSWLLASGSALLLVTATVWITGHWLFLGRQPSSGQPSSSAGPSGGGPSSGGPSSGGPSSGGGPSGGGGPGWRREVLWWAVGALGVAALDAVRAAFAATTVDASCPAPVSPFVVAPASRPENTAPLGWALSQRSQQALLDQLDHLSLDPVRALLAGTCTLAAPAP